MPSPSNKSGAAGGDRAIDALRPSDAEFEDRILPGSQADACRFGGYQGGKIDQIQEGRFKQLALDQRALDADERFMREDDAAFRDGVDVAGKAHFFEIIEKFFLEKRLAIHSLECEQIGEIAFIEMEILQIVHRCFQARCNGKSALEGMPSEEQVEHHSFLSSPAFQYP